MNAQPMASGGARGAGGYVRGFWGSLLLAGVMFGAWYTGALDGALAALLGAAAVVGCAVCTAKVMRRRGSH